jgi:hypothetical protein
MPGIRFTSFNNRSQNPSFESLPYNAGNVFLDSCIFQGANNYLSSRDPSGNEAGITLDFNNGSFLLGDGDSFINIGAGTGGIVIQGIGITSPTSGSASGQHLIIKVNGVNQKIKLNNL